MKNNLSQFLYADEEQVVKDLLKTLPWDRARADAVQDQAAALVQAVRRRKMPSGQLESFLQQYSLTTDEGLALMTLAEALLRIPDKATASALIKDKVLAANWLEASGGTGDWIVKAAGVGLLMSSKTLDSAVGRIGEPVIREAMIKAMRMLGEQFVLGEDIEEAVIRGGKLEAKGYRLSYDILGEGARTVIDAEKYYETYSQAIDYIARHAAKNKKLKRPGISVKLSALHPRYEFAQAEWCVPMMIEKIIMLAKKAAAHDFLFTIDAEEAGRLEVSLEIIQGVLASGALKDWDGFGLAVQAYQKRALPLIDHVYDLARHYNQMLQVRLVKGAYWDSEIKRAQILGLPDFPVFTRKANTDVSYLASAARLLSYNNRIYPMFGTHNAHTVTAILEMARTHDGEFEFQKLYGMGEAMYAILRERDIPVCVYAPVGPHEDLLPYLVRRLLENGANTSFVNKLMNADQNADDVVTDPVETVRARSDIRHPAIALPRDLYAKEKPHGRTNSQGYDLTDERTVSLLLKDISRFQYAYDAAPLIGGKIYKDTVPDEVRNPADHGDHVGFVWAGNKGLVHKAVRVANEGFENWNNTDAELRARLLEKFAGLLEDNTPELMALCIREAGKTIPDAVAEIREAVDFCRYYASRGRVDFALEGKAMQGPTGESNRMILNGRGVFVCISPWNFPLAIFIGQIAAALMAGNTVVAKPAEQTPLLAMKTIQLMHKAGIPSDVINLVPGDGAIGARLVAHPDIAGVAFTGSTTAAQDINRTLAAKDGPIVPLIAETGGMNVMIVDSSALPEQVIDDVVLSAFGSAGQRCSALRILCVQDEIADKLLRLLKGSMGVLKVGNPAELSTDIGPVIDEEAHAALTHHRAMLDGFGRPVFEVELDAKLITQGHFFAPVAFEIDNLSGMTREVFGPVLHILRYKNNQIHELIDDINAKGYGLTFGIHSRIESFQADMAARIKAGNIYINRSMIGAVVGAQPFGGQGLSGTGPKAGGPHYLPRFATEKVISINTAAAGGNASLVSLEE